MTTIQRRKLIRHLRVTLRKFERAAGKARPARHEEAEAVLEIARAARGLRDSHAADSAGATFAASFLVAAKGLDAAEFYRRERDLLDLAEILGALR